MAKGVINLVLYAEELFPMFSGRAKTLVEADLRFVAVFC